jgi:hypothetical protein
LLQARGTLHWDDSDAAWSQAAARNASTLQEPAAEYGPAASATPASGGKSS